ncbi:MAG: ubiquinone/menaquinone biosynthesis methyltransferase [Gemmatimonadota bacterium]
MSLKSRIGSRIAHPVDKRRYVRELFGRIAGRYDLTNDVMSLGMHRIWKRKLLELAGLRPGMTVLDLAAGTGDLAIGAAARLGHDAGFVVAGDLTPEMMRIGKARAPGAVVWVASDALELPFQDASFDRVLIGYGLRNFPDLTRCLTEIHRCLRPGGRMVALDFGKPASRRIRRFYLRYLDVSTRAVGWTLHRDPEAYLYIPESLRRFSAQQGVAAEMGRLGFVRYGYVDLLFGAMALNFGDRAP